MASPLERLLPKGGAEGPILSSQLASVITESEKTPLVVHGKAFAGALGDAVVSSLNQGTEGSPKVNEKVLQLLASLAAVPENAEWVLEVMQQLDSAFECMFEEEAVFTASSPSEAPPLHGHVLAILCRSLGEQFTAAYLLEMCKGKLETAVDTLTSLIRAGDSELICHGARLLFQLTVFDTYFDAEECTSLSSLQESTANFRRQNSELLRIVLSSPLLDALTAGLSPALAAAGGEMAPAMQKGVQYSLQLVHNMLLYSTERSAQLRKHLAHSDFLLKVLDPFLTHVVGTQAGAEGEVPSLRPVLRVVCVATCKVHLLRQHFLKSGVWSTMLAAPAVGRSVPLLDLLCRIACNLELAAPPGPVNGAANPAVAARCKEACTLLEAAARGLPEADIRKLAARFWAEVPVVPVERGSATHRWLCAEGGCIGPWDVELKDLQPTRELAAAATGAGGGGGKGGRGRRRKGKGGGGGDGGGGGGGGGSGGGGGGGGGSGSSGGGGSKNAARRRREREKRRQLRARQLQAQAAGGGVEGGAPRPAPAALEPITIAVRPKGGSPVLLGEGEVEEDIQVEESDGSDGSGDFDTEAVLKEIDDFRSLLIQ